MAPSLWHRPGRGLVPALACAWLMGGNAPVAPAAPIDSLQASFQRPPASARPWVYWFPLNGNLTKAGITADLEAMARVGIGGVLYMEVDQGAPVGPADFAGPLWLERIDHALREAKRLGLEVNFNNDAGWNGSGGPWVTPEMSMQKVVWSETVVGREPSAPMVLPQPKTERGHYRDIAVLALPAPRSDFRLPGIALKALAQLTPGPHKENPVARADFPAAPDGAAISREQTIDLTAQMDRDGRLRWTPPAGEWLVMRFGHTTTGVENKPAPATGKGLECDKLNPAAATLQFENLLGRIIQRNRSLTGQDQALVGVHIDSWENGAQNWTPRMRAEFQTRRGYDLLTFLPALAGRIVGGTEITERFLWDFRRTISEMLVENYAGTFRQLARRHGLRLTIEAYDGPCGNLPFAGQADEPMGEFWAWPRFQRSYNCTEMASAGHVYGRRIVGAEVFTSNKLEKWQGHPGNIKDLGDWALCEGINRFVFHRYAAQPWIKAAPGMSMGPWGLHYERTQTWWEQSKAWHEYLARCQSLLQQGRFVADIAYLTPEDAPYAFVAPPEAEVAPHIRSGYGFDGCPAEVVLTRMRVQDGRIVLPDGMSYRTLVLPDVETMTPVLLAKIDQLAAAGAMIVGPAKPPRRSPSLADRGAGDEKVRRTGAALWASGRILTGKTAQQFLAERGVPPDFSASPLLRYIHRRIDDAEVYFVANPQTTGVAATADFRVRGRQPEFWWPDSGRIEPAVFFEPRGDVTRVALRLEPRGSVFVVFRRPAAGLDPAVVLRQEGGPSWNLRQPWPEAPVSKIRILKAVYGVPGDPRRTRDVTAKLQRAVDSGNYELPVTEMARGDDPAFGVVKTLVVEYVAGGRTLTATGRDRETIQLQEASVAPPVAAVPTAELRTAAGGGMVLSARQAGRYEVQTVSGQTRTVRVPAVPAAREIAGPWQVHFAPAAGGPGEVQFRALEDWARRTEDGIKYYSGTAVYRTTFVAAPLAAHTEWRLDLGKVEVMAEVKLNGRDLGILWKAPYAVDVTPALQAGENRLEVRVVNLWINRQIGDEHLPEDSDRNPTGTLKAWPDWVQQEKASPTGRISFTSWRLWKKDDPLQPSGLLGPVRLIPAVQMAVP